MPGPEAVPSPSLRERLRGGVARIAASTRDVLDRVESRVIDRRYGLDTADHVELDELGIAHPERVQYEPTRWLNLRTVLPLCDVGKGDVFADLGSGKGRVVFQAALGYPFARVIGVELSPELTAIARANIERNRDRLRCRDVELISDDVLAWEIPADLTTVHLYNPFRGELFSAVVDRLIDWTDRNGRGLQVIYSTPLEHERLMATGRVRLVARPDGLMTRIRGRDAVRLYEIAPRAAATSAEA